MRHIYFMTKKNGACSLLSCQEFNEQWANSFFHRENHC